MTPEEHATEVTWNCSHLGRGACFDCIAHQIQQAIEAEREALKKIVYHIEHGYWQAAARLAREALSARSSEPAKSGEKG